MPRNTEFEYRVRIVNHHAARVDSQENLPQIIAEFENDGWTVAVIEVHVKVGTIVVFKRPRSLR
jgi:hypothetical protein